MKKNSVSDSVEQNFYFVWFAPKKIDVPSNDDYSNNNSKFVYIAFHNKPSQFS